MYIAAIAFAASSALAEVPNHPPAAAGLPAPVLSVSRLDDVKVPDTPYDGRVDANAAISRALVEAREGHKRVLIDFGGNRCADCRILSGIMRLPEIHRFLDAHYVVVLVDVGDFERNLQVPRRFGIAGRLNAIPALLVVDSSGNLLNKGHIWELGFARSMTPQAVAGWLARWAK